MRIALYDMRIQVVIRKIDMNVKNDINIIIKG